VDQGFPSPVVSCERGFRDDGETFACTAVLDGTRYAFLGTYKLCHHDRHGTTCSYTIAPTDGPHASQPKIAAEVLKQLHALRDSGTHVDCGEPWPRIPRDQTLRCTITGDRFSNAAVVRVFESGHVKVVSLE
jgi:hypothetical protein